MSPNETARYIGLMSGTSLNSIDCALVSITEGIPKLISSTEGTLPDDIRDEIAALNQPCENDLYQTLTLSRKLGILFGDTVQTLLSKTGFTASDIVAIGSHGQTIRHQPKADFPFSLQIGDPNTIAEMTGIPVVADFRSRDIAAGGEGAPLTPLMHNTLFFDPDINRCIVNIGGMSNITQLTNSSPHLGFDPGPGNIFLDYWVQKHLNKPHDVSGDWARTGKIIDPLVHAMLKDPYFTLPAPKSTGREYFNRDWLNQYNLDQYASEDVMASLVELTAQSIANCIDNDIDEIYVCGGGAHNHFLMERIQVNANGSVQSTAAIGIDPDFIEAVTFAWLAYRRINHLAGNSTASTGAKHERILGGLYL
ncbi:MAG: anhydro-N-acetylmuramic acid kinase [Cellvibrionales bacterium]|nr:anhydro-N-acetylmuramic acid kinase [Cellvibrionales bacterium]